MDELIDRLERDYRRLLRWYPRTWRAAHGEALVGTAMDAADAEDRFLVRRGEWREFAAAGLEARLDRLVGSEVRHAASTVLLSLGAGTSFSWFLLTSWAPFVTGPGAEVRGFGPFFDAAPVLSALWLLASISALAGRWWFGRIALIASVGAAVLIRPLEWLVVPSSFFALDPGALAFFIACALLAILGTPRTGLPLIAATAGWAAVAATVWVLQAQPGGGRWSNALSTLYSRPDAFIAVILVAVGLAVVLAVARCWNAAFTILLATVPLSAAVDGAFAHYVAVGGWDGVGGFGTVLVTLNTATLLGLALLLLVTRGTVRLPARRGPTTT